MDFPILISICLSANDSKFRTLGYKNGYKFFRGASLYNSSLIGWSGHTENGKIVSTPTGCVKTIKRFFYQPKNYLNILLINYWICIHHKHTSCERGTIKVIFSYVYILFVRNTERPIIEFEFCHHKICCSEY